MSGLADRPPVGVIVAQLVAFAVGAWFRGEYPAKGLGQFLQHFGTLARFAPVAKVPA